MGTSQTLSVLIPVRNEEQTVGAVIEAVLAVDTEALGFAKEVIVCDDGSTDGTWRAMERAAAHDTRVRLVQHPQNKGKGAAIRTALSQATGEYCLVQDADLEYDVSDYPLLLAEVAKGADAVYGSRFLKRKRPANMALANYLANRILTVTANTLYGLDITDEATCFKLVRTDIMRQANLQADGFDFCPEITAKLARLGVAIEEVPISYAARSIEEGKQIRWHHGFEAIYALFRHRSTPLGEEKSDDRD